MPAIGAHSAPRSQPNIIKERGYNRDRRPEPLAAPPGRCRPVGRALQRPGPTPHRPPGRRRKRALPVLLRRPLRQRVPQRHRHPVIHPPHQRRKPARRRRAHPLGQHPGRQLRPRLPHRNPLPASLRAQQRAGMCTGTDRPVAALRPGQRPLHRTPVQALTVYRQAYRRGGCRPCRAVLRAPAGHARA